MMAIEVSSKEVSVHRLLLPNLKKRVFLFESCRTIMKSSCVIVAAAAE